MHVLRTYKSSFHNHQSYCRQLCLRKADVPLAIKFFEVPTIHKTVATSGASHLFLYAPRALDFFHVQGLMFNGWREDGVLPT